MKNICYELGKLISDKIDARNIYFAGNVNSINDLRRAIAGLKGLDSDTSNRAVMLLEELERNYHGKALYMQIDDIKRNMSGILALLLKVKGEEVALEEAEAA